MSYLESVSIFDVADEFLKLPSECAILLKLLSLRGMLSFSEILRVFYSYILRTHSIQGLKTSSTF